MGRNRVLTLALVAASQAVFLWMFLSTDPLEQLAASGALAPVGDAAIHFASDWRHGMRGNSWLYMPGFFAMAAALWLHARRSPALGYLAVEAERKAKRRRQPAQTLKSSPVA